MMHDVSSMSAGGQWSSMTGASIALAVMATQADRYVSDPKKADFGAAAWILHWLLAVVFAGSVAGMLSMGCLGDLIGHGRALLVTKGLVVLGCFMCTLLPEQPDESGFWGQLILWRFIIGVGLGGAYPLTAAVAGKANDVGKAFFWQTPGSVAPYLVALLVLKLLPGQTSPQFRWILGLGAVPSFLALGTSISDPVAQPVRPASQLGLWEGLPQALSCPRLQRRLLGTAGSWFLFDVAAYGTTIFTPQILSYVFGKDHSLVHLAWHSILLLSWSIPATWLSVLALSRWRARRLNLLGFVLQAVLFATFASAYGFFYDMHKVLLALLCAIYFGLNWGVCVSTYVLPIEVFPEEFRGTLHGVSAAAGKLGALVGACLFPLLNTIGGVPAVMGLQAVVCGMGAWLSLTCLPPDD
ncbi:unnamed protein product [Durusdinium trenchii]|uniref:Major facilitator superfamily (MFS) profile domain-containing protein n=1 Tax=Durusdinium trenchii TaxID=1381693 RepID=A0ABP0NFH1_9DINO